MNLHRLISLLSFLALMACAPNLYAEESASYPENYYKYTNIRGPLEYIYIINDSDHKAAVYVDEEVGREIQHDPESASPTILSFDWPRDVVFYLPEDFDADMKEWAYKKCRYEIVTYSYGFRPSANQVVYEYLIEQKCEGDPEVVRFEYADYWGLQSFGVGEYKDAPDKEPVFEVEDVYALYGAEIGFGARQ